MSSLLRIILLTTLLYAYISSVSGTVKCGKYEIYVASGKGKEVNCKKFSSSSESSESDSESDDSCSKSGSCSSSSSSSSSCSDSSSSSGSDSSESETPVASKFFKYQTGKCDCNCKCPVNSPPSSSSGSSSCGSSSSSSSSSSCGSSSSDSESSEEKKYCYCQKGYARNSKGYCIPESQCIKNSCGQNEVYMYCGTACPKTCEKLDNSGCTKNCVVGCFCKDGYVRNIDNQCIPVGQCPKCGVNRKFSKLAPTCKVTCDSMNLPCAKYTKHEPGCYCLPGYVENCKGQCVKATEYCKPCKPNEFYTNCGQFPEPTCDNPDMKPALGRTAGCVCQKGYIRDYNGNCILKKNCPKCEDPNSEWSVYGPTCKVNCLTFGTACTKRTNKKPGCYCKPGYVENCQGKCVKAAVYCQKCKAYEYYSDCAPMPEPTCLNPFMKPTTKAKGCVCQPGYVRDYFNKCVLANTCPSCKDPMSEWSNYGPTCDLNCETLGKPCTKRTKLGPGCFCKLGYVKNCAGKCVKATEYCKSCKTNEYFSDCVSVPERSCDYPAVVATGVKAKCTCRPGYIRDYFGDCILENKCPKCEDPMSEYTILAPTCDLNCENLGLPCTQKTQKNPGCYCKKGFVKNCAGKCVSASVYCKTCKANEFYTDCGRFPEPSCDKPNQNPASATAGCVCKTGYIRDYDGNCILRKNCPNCIDPNSEYSNLAPSCEVNCETLGMACTKLTVKKPGCYCKPGYVQNCRGTCVLAADYCKTCKPNEYYSECAPLNEKCCENPDLVPSGKTSKCTCRKGYIRDYDGNCVLPENCPGCDDPMAEYSVLAPTCELNCENLGKQCTERTLKSPGCYCKPGYVKNCAGVCVKSSIYCKTCKPTEYYSDCGPTPEPTCENQYLKPTGKAAKCVCKTGFIRDANGICVLPRECPNCPDPMSEYTFLAPSCDLTCDNLGKACTKKTVQNPGCYCKDGYVKNCAGKCVLAKEFCRTCGENQLYTDCARLPEASCETPNPKSTTVASACICRPGYIRDYNGKCVTKNQCPSCTDPMAEYSLDAPTCDVTCETFGNPCTKKTQRNPGCYCKDGYVKNCDDKCVSANDYCQSCKPYEYYTDCASNPQPSCAQPNPAANGTIASCVCRPGYIRDYDGNCVQVKDCPKCLEPMTEYSNYGPTCDLTCETLGQPCQKRTAKKPGCYCLVGYVKNCLGKCVKASDYCTPCGNNEFFTDCGPVPERSCEYPNSQPATRAPKCICKSGYIRDYNGKCILKNDCPSCPDPMSEYSLSGPTCDLNCETFGKACTQRTSSTPGCYCKEGYVKDCSGKCVSASKYCQQCSPSEYYSDCGPAVEPNCEDPSVSPSGKKAGCACRPGFIRDYDGNCVTPSSCPKCDDPMAEYSIMAPTCDPTCENLGDSCNQKTKKAPGCYCKPGYVKNCAGVCVQSSVYCKNCDNNAYYTDCGLFPERTCKVPSPQGTTKKGGCVCKKGYIRDYWGKCSLEKDCPQCPGQNMEYTLYAPTCKKYTCEELGNPCLKRTLLKPGCECLEGFVQTFTGQCVDPKVFCKKCPDYQYFSDYTLAPEPTCGNQNPSPNGKIIKGCVCQVGYARNCNHCCIAFTDCPNAKAIH